MRISIIITTLNSGKTIAQTLDSVLSQTYKDIELIVIDGASTDQTLSVLSTYKQAISHLVSEPDKGIYFAMNKGLKLASGGVVGILNSDDFYADNQVLSDVAALFTRTHSDAIYADLHYVDAANTQQIKRNWKSGIYKKNAFLYGWMPPHPTLFVKNEMYKKYGDFNTALHSAADYELMLRFIHKHQISIAYLPRVIVKMRTGGTSNKSIRNRILANREDRQAWRINGIKPFFFTLYLKPVRKIFQFVFAR